MVLGLIDILTIIIVMILIIAIIIINLTNLINKKLTGIAVNIPPIEIPDPNITVKIQRNCNKEMTNDNDDFRIFIEKNGSTQYSISPKIESEHTVGKIENFAQVGNEQKLSYPNPSGKFTVPSGELCGTVQDEITIKNKILEEKLNRQYNIPKEEIITPEIKNILKNKQLNKRFLNEAYKYMIENDSYTKEQYDKHNKYLMDKYRDMDEGEFDPNTWYKQFQIKVPTYLEDLKTRGYNLDAYDNVGNIYSVGKINLNDNHYKNPKPNGFIFNNSVANLK